MSLSLALLPFLLACEAEPDRPFGGGVGGDGGSTAADGGAGDGGDADGGASDGVSPTILSVEADFYTPPNYDTVLQVYIYWEDPQEDLKGGSVVFSVRGSDGAQEDGVLQIGGSEARMDNLIEGSPIFFWLQGVNTSATYEVDVMLKDMAGNDSQVAKTST